MPDAQAGHETTLSATLAALAGANVIYGLGMLEMGITFDYAKLVMDNEFAGMILHALKGIEVNENNLALDVIREIGPGGEFVSNMHTFQNFKAHQSAPRIIDRRMPEEWAAAGSKDIVERANEKALDLYENYQVEPIKADISKTMRDAVNEAESDYQLPLSEYDL